MWGIVGNCVILTIKTKSFPFWVKKSKRKVMRFIGTIEAKMDSKGRVFLPATFRRILLQDPPTAEDSRLIMRKDIFEDCLVLYSQSEWYGRLDELRLRLSLWNKQEQAVMRKYVTDAEWLQIDSNGRILIPKRYLNMAHIESQVTFVGMDSTIEIWSTPLLQQQTTDQDFAQTIQEIFAK